MTAKILHEFTFGRDSRYTLVFRDDGATTIEAGLQQVARYESVRQAFLDILELFASFPPETEPDRLLLTAIIDVLDAAVEE